MNLSNAVIDGLQSGLDAVARMAPLASELGAGPMAKLAGSLAEIASNTLERIQEGRVVATERQASVIRHINAELATHNDALAALIAKS